MALNDYRHGDLNFDVDDLERMVRMLDRMGISPQRTVQKAASKGMTVVRRSVRGLVPVGKKNGGTLKRSLYRKGEHAKVKGKKVYDLAFNPNMNDVLQKPVRRPGFYGSNATWNGHAYYPASMEYGFLARKPNGNLTYYRFHKRILVPSSSRPSGWKRKYVILPMEGYEGQRIEGQHFLERGTERAAPQASKVMIDTMAKEIIKIWTKG